MSSTFALELIISDPIKEVEKSLRKVIGVPLMLSIHYAFVDLVSMKTVGGSYLEGRIPTIVASCGDFMRGVCKWKNLSERTATLNTRTTLDILD